MVYPVGSIYISINPTNPEELFNCGTWESFGTGRTIVGVDSSQTEFASVGKTGGEKTHALTIGEIPEHAGHLYKNSGVVYNGTANGLHLAKGVFTTYGTSPRGWNNNQEEMYPVGHSIGSGYSHNNLQPYIAVYMWKRVS